MSIRLDTLSRTLEAYRTTGVSLVQRYPHGGLGPAGVDDDPGLYYVVPKLAAWFHVPVGQAAAGFFYALCAVALAAGVAGLLLYSRTTIGRTFGVVALVFAAVMAARVGDVYVALAAVAIACAPWLLWIAKRDTARASLIGLPVIGVAAAASNLLRSQSGTAILVFGAALLLLPARRWRDRLRDIGLLVLGAAIIWAAFAGVAHQRDAFLASQPGAHRADDIGHPFWHSVYIGFGYLPNPYVGSYDDAVGLAKARQIDPSVMMYSKRYEQILRDQVLALVLTHPGFVAKTVAAKAWMMTTWLLVFANVGLLAAVLARKPASVDVAFGLALAFEALFGLLIIPRSTYALGFMAFAALYAAVSVEALAARRPREAALLAGPALGAAAMVAEAGLTGVYGSAFKPAMLPFQLLCIAGWVWAARLYVNDGYSSAALRFSRVSGLLERPLSEVREILVAPVFVTALGMTVAYAFRYELQRHHVLKFPVLIIAGPLAVLASWAVAELSGATRRTPPLVAPASRQAEGASEAA